MVSPYVIRVFGDPVLKRACSPIEQIDDTVRALAADMMTTMYDAPGVGLAGNQVGVQKRIFTYDAGDGNGPGTLLNPEIVESSGEWMYEEGCLSVPKMYFKFPRAKSVTVRATDLEGKEVIIEASDFLARIFQHEIDHLDGYLLLDRLDQDDRKKALKTLRDRQLKGE